jgi:protein-S-isoprenylcysteine O-methyltransferase Ste14
MTISVELIIRTLIIIIFFIWYFYWAVTDISSDAEGPKIVTPFPRIYLFWLRRTTLQIFTILVVLQLFGIQIFSIYAPNYILFFSQVLGLLLVLVGIKISILARQAISSNWVYAYQIKKKQPKVTSQVYKFIRHPMYAGLVLALLGSELVVQSYLVIAVFVVLFGVYQQAKWEEQILKKHYGNSYLFYLKHSKMFIPFLW